MTTKVKITETLDAGNDVLIVRGEVDGKPVEARGWHSAMTHHHPPSAYVDVAHRPNKKGHHVGHAVEGRHLKPGAKARPMSAAERRAYCERLLAEACAPSEANPKPINLL